MSIRDTYPVGSKVIVLNAGLFHSLKDGSTAEVLDPAEGGWGWDDPKVNGEYLRVRGVDMVDGTPLNQWLRAEDVKAVATDLDAATSVDEAKKVLTAAFVKWANEQGIWRPETFLESQNLLEFVEKRTVMVSFPVEVPGIGDAYDQAIEVKQAVRKIMRDNKDKIAGEVGAIRVETK